MNTLEERLSTYGERLDAARAEARLASAAVVTAVSPRAVAPHPAGRRWRIGVAIAGSVAVATLAGVTVIGVPRPDTALKRGRGALAASTTAAPAAVHILALPEYNLSMIEVGRSYDWSVAFGPPDGSMITARSVATSATSRGKAETKTIGNAEVRGFAFVGFNEYVVSTPCGLAEVHDAAHPLWRPEVTQVLGLLTTTPLAALAPPQGWALRLSPWLPWGGDQRGLRIDVMDGVYSATVDTDLVPSSAGNPGTGERGRGSLRFSVGDQVATFLADQMAVPFTADRFRGKQAWTGRLGQRLVVVWIEDGVTYSFEGPFPTLEAAEQALRAAQPKPLPPVGYIAFSEVLGRTPTSVLESACELSTEQRANLNRYAAEVARGDASDSARRQASGTSTP